jgi:hypothetical protein
MEMARNPKSLSVTQVWNRNPCREYTKQDIKKHFAGRKRLTGLDFLNIKEIPIMDRVWGVLQTLTKAQERELARWCDAVVGGGCTIMLFSFAMSTCESCVESSRDLWCALDASKHTPHAIVIKIRNMLKKEKRNAKV